MRRAHRLDANHSKLVRVFEDMGCSVLDLAAVGNGCPDILIARNGKMRLCEIKDGAKSPSQRQLTEHQVRFHALWNAEISIVENLHDVELIVNSL